MAARRAARAGPARALAGKRSGGEPRGQVPYTHMQIRPDARLTMGQTGHSPVVMRQTDECDATVADLVRSSRSADRL